MPAADRRAAAAQQYDAGAYEYAAVAGHGEQYSRFAQEDLQPLAAVHSFIK